MISLTRPCSSPVATAMRPWLAPLYCCGRNAANDELIAALLHRARQIQALADPPACEGSARKDEVLRGEQAPVSPTDGDDLEQMAAWMRRAQACGFHFWQPHPGAAWWGERQSTQWRDVVFLHPSKPSNAARAHRAPGAGSVAQQISGDALGVLRTVCEDWPI